MLKLRVSTSILVVFVLFLQNDILREFFKSVNFIQLYLSYDMYAREMQDKYDVLLIKTIYSLYVFKYID